MQFKNNSSYALKICISVVFLFSLLFINALPAAASGKNCNECHDKIAALKKSIHSDLDCEDCHGKVYVSENKDASLIHGGNQYKAKCNECHEDVVKDYEKDLHAVESAIFEGRKVTCSECHGSHNIINVFDPKSRVMVRIKEKLNDSVHAGYDCKECHEKYEFGKDRPKPGCKKCHDDVTKIYDNSVHGRALQKKDKDVAMCYDCHGSHQIVEINDPRSKVFKLNLPVTCAKCHSNKFKMQKHKIAEPEAASRFMDSMHGKALTKLGLVVAPSCNDCHGVHNIQNHKHEDSPISHKNIPDTCGKCHVGIEDVYNASIHGQVLAKGDPNGPVCITCHTSHSIGSSDELSFKQHSDEVCGSCHEDKLKNYRETYHGKAMAIGQGKVAACFDCHGKHDIYPENDYRSHLFRGKAPDGVNKDNLIKTCQKCHPKAEPKFAGYYTHADHTDKADYPMLYWVYIFMTALLLGTFGFFGVHTVLWLTRTLYFYIKDPKSFKELKIKLKKDDEIYSRFAPIDRFTHVLVMVSFLLLVLTGMPLKFYDTDWGKFMFDMMGGSEVAQSVHRFAAIITLVYFVLHLMTLIYRMIKAWGRSRARENGKLKIRALFRIIVGPDSPLFNKQDWRDVVAHQKFFFGKGPRPQFDKWTYWEKFDYWAVFWGVGVIGLSGLIMWLPEFATSFLPGWIINIALIIHSDEALLAAGFIFTFHFFNVHFRPEKFPIDSVIFSGRISRTEMEHERGRQLKRMEDEGTINEYMVKDEWESWKKIVHPLGYLAFGIGVVLILLIYWAMFTRLF